MPGCEGFQVLAQPVKFSWPGIEEVQDTTDWGYYRCSQSPTAISAFYRGRMTKPPYNWMEFNYVELPEGVLGVYYHAVRQNWLYLWVLPDSVDKNVVLVVTERDVSEPLTLPCCGR
jgi:hypothetical protein